MKARIAFVLKNKKAFEDISNWGYNCKAALAIDLVIRNKFGYSIATTRFDILRGFMRAYDRLFTKAGQAVDPKIVEPVIDNSFVLESVKKKRKHETETHEKIDYEKVAIAIKGGKPAEVIDKERVYEVASRDLRVKNIYKFLEGDIDARLCK